MPRKKPPTRTLTPEEEEDWQQTAGVAKPLRTKERNIPEAQKSTIQRKVSQPARADRPQIKKPLPPLKKGGYEGIDKNTQKRFKRGEYPIDARLDLHGLTREEAQKRVEDFIHRNVLEGNRFLLIVTGKGSLGVDKSEPKRGVLRELLPSWLAEDSLRPYILACDTAAVKHGGNGAVYVLLRRER